MDDLRLARLTREFGDEEIAGLLVSARRRVVQTVPQRVAHRHLTAMLTVTGAIGIAAAGASSATALSGMTAAATGTSGVASAAASGVATSGAAAAATTGVGAWSVTGVALVGVKLTAAAAAVGLAVAGGLAITGSLPDAAQQLVSDVAERVGIGLPAPDPQPGAPGQDGSPASREHDERRTDDGRTDGGGTAGGRTDDGRTEETPRQQDPKDVSRGDSPRREDVPREGEPTSPPGAPDGKGSDHSPGQGSQGGDEPTGSDDGGTDPVAETPTPPPGQSDKNQGKAPADRGGPHTPLDEAGHGRASEAIQESAPPEPTHADTDASDDDDGTDQQGG